MSAEVGTEPRRRVLIRLVDAAGRLGEHAGLSPSPVSGRRILERVRRRTGLHDLGDGEAEEGLRVLAASIETEARPGAFGREVVRGMIAQSIERRLRILDLVARTPQIRAQTIRRPLFIVSPPRTGTTLLYNLLAQDPAARPLLSWEAYDPFPPSRTGWRGRDPRIARHRRNVRFLDWLAPDLQRIHPVTADGPEECVPLLMRTFVTGVWSMFANVPTYDAWVRSRPAATYDAAYRHHRDQLRLLQWQRPEGHWLLKSPAHTLALPALLRVYPDAVVVRTHRDLCRVLPSALSLFRAARSLLEGPVDTRALGQSGLAMAQDLLARVMRPLPDSARERVVDVRYADLVADPLGTVERIQRAAGREVTAEMAEGVERWLEANPRHKQAVHRYRLEDYGLDPEEVGELSEAYHRRFDVPPEHEKVPAARRVGVTA